MKLSRRNVQIVTVVSMLAMVGGFALGASVVPTWAGFPGASQNTGALSMTSTIWSGTNGTSSVSYVIASGPGSCPGPTTVTSGTASVTVITWVPGAPGATCASTQEYAEEFVFQTSSKAAGTAPIYTDTITFSTGT